MKRVLLKNKKTGVIGELSGVNRIVVYEPDMPLCGNSILGEYDTLAKLNEEWEDYNPIKPLIKDKKIRKAVRVWAEVNDVKQVTVIKTFNTYTFYPADTGVIDISFWTEPSLSNLSEDKIYTIIELIGEKE